MRITESQLRKLIVEELFNDLMLEQPKDDAEAGSALSTDEEGEGGEEGEEGEEEVDIDYSPEMSNVKLPPAVQKVVDPKNLIDFDKKDKELDEKGTIQQQAAALAGFALTYADGDLGETEKMIRKSMQAARKMAPDEEALKKAEEEARANESVSPSRLKEIIQEEIFRHFMNK